MRRVRTIGNLEMAVALLLETGTGGTPIVSSRVLKRAVRTLTLASVRLDSVLVANYILKRLGGEGAHIVRGRTRLPLRRDLPLVPSRCNLLPPDTITHHRRLFPLRSDSMREKERERERNCSKLSSLAPFRER